jgi:cell shape-determining protein MreC
MPRTLPTSQKAFLAVLAPTLALALLPARWLRWTNDIAGIVSAPLAPLAQLGVATAAWLRPPRGPIIDLPESAARIIEERDRFESLFHAEALRVQALEEQLAQLQQVPLENLRVPVRLVLADVIGRSPGAAAGVIELKRGARDGVKPGTVAVYAGVHLIGQVREVDHLRSLMVPLANPSIGLIAAAVRPRDRASSGLRTATRLHLRAAGDGTLLADVDRELDIHTGDDVVLVDESWPAAAQAMVLGTVQGSAPLDEAPLRSRIIVRPRYQAHELAYVTLKIEIPPASSGDSERDGA